MLRWNEKLWLFTEDEFNQLPDGITLTCINGHTVVKGKEYIDMDTRAGHIAYGIDEFDNHPQRDLFIKFKLVQ